MKFLGEIVLYRRELCKMVPMSRSNKSKRYELGVPNDRVLATYPSQRSDADLNLYCDDGENRICTCNLSTYT